MPTFAESGFPGYEVVEHITLFAPAGTPEPVARRINATVAATDLVARIGRSGLLG